MIVVPPVVPLGAAGGQRFWCLCDWSDRRDYQFWLSVLKRAEICSLLVRQIWPVLEGSVSFETEVATELARTFRCNLNVLLQYCQFANFSYS